MSNVVDYFTKIVQIDSPSGHEEKMAQFLLEELGKMGINARKDSHGNLYARIQGEGDPIFFCAHMDTVEPGQGIKPQVGKDYITSDGTTILGGDDKVAIASILQLLGEIKDKKHRPLDLIFTVCEETDTSGAINFDSSLLLSSKGYCFDSSNPVGTVITASPFYERFDVHILGKAAHASKPEEGNNVLFVLKEIFADVKVGRIDEETTVNIGVVKAGDVRNTIPGIGELHGEIRSLVERKLEKEKEQIKAIFVSLQDKYKVAIRQDWVVENPGYKHESAQALGFIAQTENIIQGIGITPQRMQAGGVSDANIFNDEGLLCVNLGDGTESTHTRQERVKISELENLLRLMTALVTS